MSRLYRSPTKRGNNRSRTPGSSSPQNGNPSSTNNLYFCHYTNAMYMGGIRSFKKEGRGILLHDSGISILGNYSNDLLHGHSILFSQHCILSGEFLKGKLVEGVYRTDGFLLQMELNADGQLEGKSILLIYSSKKLNYLEFRRGVMVKKEEEKDAAILSRIFEIGDLTGLVGKIHAKVLKYEFERSHNIEGQKYGNKLTIGF